MGNSCLTNFDWCGHEVNHIGRIWLDGGGYGLSWNKHKLHVANFLDVRDFFFNPQSAIRDSKSNILNNLVLRTLKYLYFFGVVKLKDQ